MKLDINKKLITRDSKVIEISTVVNSIKDGALYQVVTEDLQSYWFTYDRLAKYFKLETEELKEI